VKWLLILVLIAFTVVTVVLVKNNLDKNTDNDGQQSVNTDEGKEKPEEKSEQETEDKKEESAKPEEKAPQYEGESPNVSESLTGMITYAGVMGDKLVVRVNIDQFLQTGNCKINIIKDGDSIYNNTVLIQESVTTSTCDGFDIPVSQLVSGNLQAEVFLESGDRSGKIVEEIHI
jgi:hypothetical protein